jgi:hypothetical protein
LRARRRRHRTHRRPFVRRRIARVLRRPFRSLPTKRRQAFLEFIRLGRPRIVRSFARTTCALRIGIDVITIILFVFRHVVVVLFARTDGRVVADIVIVIIIVVVVFRPCVVRFPFGVRVCRRPSPVRALNKTSRAKTWIASSDLYV